MKAVGDVGKVLMPELPWPYTLTLTHALTLALSNSMTCTITFGLSLLRISPL